MYRTCSPILCLGHCTVPGRLRCILTICQGDCEGFLLFPVSVEMKVCREMTFQFLLELMPLKETILSSIKNQILMKKNFYSDFLSYIYRLNFVSCNFLESLIGNALAPMHLLIILLIFIP